MFDKSEEEQLQILKEWFRKNYLWLILILSLTIGGSWGWIYFDDVQREEQRNASALYDDVSAHARVLVNETDKEKQQTIVDQMVDAVDTIVGLYPDNIYASMSQALYASSLAGVDRLEAASAILQTLVSSEDEIISSNAIIGLAKVYWQQGKDDQALALLVDIPTGFSWLARELEGDIYLSQNRREDAAQAYQQAIENQPAPDNMLQIKLNNVTN